MPGVYLGAYLADLNGGYKGKGLAPALTICCLFAGFFSLFAIWDCYNFNFYFWVLVTWLYLLCGAAIMPIGQGIIVSCVPKFAQNSASSLYAIFLNLFGYTLAPVLSGYAAAQYDNKRDGMISAYRVILSASLLLFVLYILARAVAIRQILTLQPSLTAKSTPEPIMIVEMPAELVQPSHTERNSELQPGTGTKATL